MAANTPYLNLVKPDMEDWTTYEYFNTNSDILDEVCHNLQSEIQAARSTFASLNARLAAIEQAISDLDTRVTALENNS